MAILIKYENSLESTFQKYDLFHGWTSNRRNFFIIPKLTYCINI